MSVDAVMVVIEEAAVDAAGQLRVAGWASGAARVEALEVIVAGVRIGQADYGRSRPDVAADHPDFIDAANCGFAFSASLEPHLRQAEQAFVLARIEGRPAQAASRGIAREETDAAPPDDLLRFHCDKIAVYDDGGVEIAGWAAHLHEIVRIEARLDGAPIGEATIGGRRPDVEASHPNIPSAGRSGFEFRAALDEIAAGEHEIALTLATREDDRFVRKLVAATQIAKDSHRAERQDIRLFVDSPQIVEGAMAEPVRRMLAVEGWAIAQHGLAAIEAYLDGAPVGTASRGARRLDIGAAYPDWPDSLMSGFALMLPRKVFSRDRHTLRLVARDQRGHIKETEFTLEVESADAEDERGRLRTSLTQAEVDLKLALIAASGLAPRFAVIVLPSPDGDDLAATLESLGAQAYREFSPGVMSPAEPIARLGEATGAPVCALSPCDDIAWAMEALAPEGEAYALVLRAGDRLGADALLEFAVEIATRPEEDFRYADDRRTDPARGKLAPSLKPEWSPDLLLSTNYIGRAWCASADLVGRVDLKLGQIVENGGYDLALRLTEAAHEIGRAPLVLFETPQAGDEPEREARALRAAMARRGIAGGLRATAAPGVYRMRRRLHTKGLVSVIAPTIASGGLIEKCLASLRAHTAYDKFEIVVVDNMTDADSPWKAWLREHADCVVEYPAAFNWSKLNNLGAAAGLGEYLLFLNDDVEASDPRWLHAMLEHAQRPEVGVVGPRLLYPDGRVQHAGMILADSHARHAFRFADADDVGPFGLAAAQRNVAAVTGAAMLMRRAVFDELGGFDESHAIVNNDIDFCLRVWRAGLRVVYTPHATLIHHEMASRAAMEDAFDDDKFDADWRDTLALGDPFFHPRLARDDGHYAPDPEPARLVVAGRPLIARDAVRRILVQKLDHVGDFITALPAIQRLKRRFPDAEIFALVPTASVALAKWEPAIAGAIEFNFFHFVSQQGRLEIGEEELAALEAKLKPFRFDVAVDLRKLGDTRDILKLSGARLKAGFDQRGAFPWLDVAVEWEGDPSYLDKRQQVSEDYILLAEAVATACESDRAALSGPSPGDALAALRDLPALADLRPGLFDKPLVGVQPASGNVLRQWPAEHFAQLIDLIVGAYDVHIALIGAPNEGAAADAVLENLRAKSRAWSLVGLTRLDETPLVMRAMRLFVGNNSGPHHIAAALGVPTIGVHSGVVSVREWGPLGPMAAAVQREMSCGPCYLSKPTLCPRGLACLQGLRPSEVFRLCEPMLGATLRYAAD